MFHQLLFLAVYLGLLFGTVISPFVGVLLYTWIENLPPEHTYQFTLFPGNLSLVVGALTFFMWLIWEKKTIPKPPALVLPLVLLLVWINVTTFYALVPDAAVIKWDRTLKVIGFAILTAQMLSTRARLEAFMWVLVLTVGYFALPGAIKTILSGGGSAIAAGIVVVAEEGSFFGDRVEFSVVMAITLSFVLYLARHTTLLPPSRWLRLAMLIVAGSFLIALVGTFARTGLLAGAAALLMVVAKSRRKASAITAVVATVLVLLAFAPETWFDRMDTIVHYEGDSSAENRTAAWAWAWRMALQHPIVGGGFRAFFLDAAELGRAHYIEAHNIFFEMMAEHGFVGLALFCWLLIAGYSSCAVVLRRVRSRDDLAWAADLARAVQIALVAFIVGGMFVSIDTSPFLYNLTAIAIGLNTIVRRESAASVRGLVGNQTQLSVSESRSQTDSRSVVRGRQPA
jgi:probable O-glycosylation ligase (exosortase A-associated)